MARIPVENIADIDPNGHKVRVMDAQRRPKPMRRGKLRVSKARLLQGRQNDLNSFGHGHKRPAPQFGCAGMASVVGGMDDLQLRPPLSDASMRICQARQMRSARMAMTAMAMPARKPMPKLPFDRPI